MKTIATITMPKGALRTPAPAKINDDLVYIKEEDMHEYKLMVKDPVTGSWATSQYISIGHLIILLQSCIKDKGGSFHWDVVIKAISRLNKIENIELLRYVDDLKKVDKMLASQAQKNAYLRVQAKESLAKIKEQKGEIEYYTGQISWYEQILGQMGAGQLLGERPNDREDEDYDDDDRDYGDERGDGWGDDRF